MTPFPINIPEPTTEFMLKYPHLLDKFDSYCIMYRGIKSSKEIFIDFYAEHGLKDEATEALQQSGVEICQVL